MEKDLIDAIRRHPIASQGVGPVAQTRPSCHGQTSSPPHAEHGLLQHNPPSRIHVVKDLDELRGPYHHFRTECDVGNRQPGKSRLAVAGLSSCFVMEHWNSECFGWALEQERQPYRRERFAHGDTSSVQTSWRGGGHWSSSSARSLEDALLRTLSFSTLILGLRGIARRNRLSRISRP